MIKIKHEVSRMGIKVHLKTIPFKKQKIDGVLMAIDKEVLIQAACSLGTEGNLKIHIKTIHKLTELPETELPETDAVPLSNGSLIT